MLTRSNKAKSRVSVRFRQGEDNIISPERCQQNEENKEEQFQKFDSCRNPFSFSSSSLNKADTRSSSVVCCLIIHLI